MSSLAIFLQCVRGARVQEELRCSGGVHIAVSRLAIFNCSSVCPKRGHSRKTVMTERCQARLISSAQVCPSKRGYSRNSAVLKGISEQCQGLMFAVVVSGGGGPW